MLLVIQLKPTRKQVLMEAFLISESPVSPWASLTLRRPTRQRRSSGKSRSGFRALRRAGRRHRNRSRSGSSCDGDTVLGALGRIVGQAAAAVVEDPCEGGPAFQAVVHRLGRRAFWPERLAFLAHPGFERVGQRADFPAACATIKRPWGNLAPLVRAVQFRRQRPAFRTKQRPARWKVWRSRTVPIALPGS